MRAVSGEGQKEIASKRSQDEQGPCLNCQRAARAPGESGAQQEAGCGPCDNRDSLPACAIGASWGSPSRASL